MMLFVQNTLQKQPIKLCLLFLPAILLVFIIARCMGPQHLLASPLPSQRRLIVLDPGHGGTNLGAPSVRPHIFEKHITLQIAKLLRARLVKEGFIVRLTREKDRYLTLRERGHMANQYNADLFVSLHANATQNHAQLGYETFILSPRAIEVDTPALRRESGRQRPGLPPAMARLLDDIEQSSSQVAAASFAHAIQTHMRKLRGKGGDRGVRQDAMHVLLGATMPALLVEVGFIDHPVEGEELMQPSMQKAIANAIANAILARRNLLERS